MKRVIFILFLIFSTFKIVGQENGKKNKPQFGFIIGADFALNLNNRMLNRHLDRKLLFGLTYVDRSNKYVLFGGAGFKFSRFGLIKPTFASGFLNDVKDNYSSIYNNETDSVEAVGIYNHAKGEKEGYQYLRGMKTLGLQTGIIFNTKYRINPIVQYYFGLEILEFYNGALFYTSGEKGGNDYTYSLIEARFHIVTIGASIPFSLEEKQTISLNFNAGFNYTNYGELSLEDLPFTSFTKGNLSEKYGKQINFLFSVSVFFTADFNQLF